MITLFVAILTSIILYYKYEREPIVKTDYNNYDKIILQLYTLKNSTKVDRNNIIKSLIHFTEQYSTSEDVRIILNK
jgi:hypothetical protein